MKQQDLDPRLILDQVPALLFSGRPDGYIDYVNRRWLDEVGAPLEAVEGRGWMNFIHPDDLEEHLRIWEAALASGDPAISEARVRRVNGEYRWMLFRTLPLRDELGRIVRWFGSSVDIEESRRAREAIQNAERDLRTILETIPALVWTARPDGAIEFTTRSSFERMGQVPEDLLGWGWSNSVHPEDRDRAVRNWREAVAAGRLFEQEIRLPDSHGNYRWFLARAVPLRDDAGAVLHWYGTLTDIHDRKCAEQELHDLKEQLRKENIALRDEISQTSMFEEIVGSSEPLRRVLAARREGGADGFDSADHGGNGHRQGAHRPGHPQAIAARGRTLRVGQLRRHPAIAHQLGAVRT